MQSTGLNALVALVAAPPAQGQGAAASGADDSGTQSQHFSQLLSDSGKQDGQQTHQQASGTKLLQASASGALSAQEVVSPAEQIAQLLAQREQMVSPDDATGLLKRLDTMMGQSTDTTETQALAQIKSQLQAIITTGTPKSIADILQASPLVREAKLSMVGLTAMLTIKKVDDSAAEKNANNQDEEGDSAAVAMQAPVVVFRPDAGTAAATAAATKNGAKKEEVKKDDTSDVEAVDADATVTVVVPLALAVTQPVVVPSSIVPQVSGTDISIKDTMLPAVLKPRSDLDQAIPPLTSNDDTDALPDVNLPKMGKVAASDADKAAASDFQSMAAAAGADAAKATDDKHAAAKLQTDLSTLNNINPQTGNGTGTQTFSAVQPVAVTQTPGLVNHAQVTDQVSVSVTKAAADGINHITIQLDPMGLGRVEVNMHTNHDGQTQISFTVDKADTFDNLSRDARSLERSLQEAGIKADTGSMQFNMRQQPQQQQLHSDMGSGQGQRSQQQANAEGSTASSTTTSVAAIIPSTTRNYLFNVREGVDISA